MSDLMVAKTIKNQIGGLAFAMMGAKNLVGGDKYLQFKVGSNPKNVSTVKVELDPNDTYKVSFYNRRGNLIKEAEEVYVDMLHGIIESNTGLYLRM